MTCGFSSRLTVGLTSQLTIDSTCHLAIGLTRRLTVDFTFGLTAGSIIDICSLCRLKTSDSCLRCDRIDRERELIDYLHVPYVNEKQTSVESYSQMMLKDGHFSSRIPA